MCCCRLIGYLVIFVFAFSLEATFSFLPIWLALVIGILNVIFIILMVLLLFLAKKYLVFRKIYVETISFPCLF